MTVRELSNLTQCRWHHSIAGDPLCKWTGEPSMSMNSSCSISDYEASTAHFPAMMDLALWPNKHFSQVVFVGVFGHSIRKATMQVRSRRKGGHISYKLDLILPKAFNLFITGKAIDSPPPPYFLSLPNIIFWKILQNIWQIRILAKTQEAEADIMNSSAHPPIPIIYTD